MAGTTIKPLVSCAGCGARFEGGFGMVHAAGCAYWPLHDWARADLPEPPQVSYGLPPRPLTPEEQALVGRHG